MSFNPETFALPRGIGAVTPYPSYPAVTPETLKLSTDPDDTLSIQRAVNAYPTVVFSAGTTYNISSAITLPSNTTLQMYGATFVVACGSNPVFQTAVAAEQIRLFGGKFTGTAGVLLKAIGSTDTPSQESNYARNIYLEGIRISDGTIGIALWINKAARKIFIDSCTFLSANGILSDGKGVEVYCSKTLIYSGTQAAGTYGVKLTSSGGTNYYNEGWYFSICELAESTTPVYLADYFTVEFVGCLLQGLAAGHSALLTVPTTTTLCFGAIIDSCSILDADISISTPSFNSGASVRNCTFANQSTQGVLIGNGTVNIDLSDLRFINSNSAAAGVIANGNNTNLFINGIHTDSSYTNAIQIKGAGSSNNQIHNVKHEGSGQAVYLESTVLLKSVPLQTSGDIGNVWTFNAASLVGTVTVGNPIATVTTGFSKGETGYIVVKISCSGLDAVGSQRFDITTPTGITVPTGTGWTSKSIMPEFPAGVVSVMIPYTSDRDIASGTVTITNAAGNSATIDFHSYFGIQRVI